MAGMASTTGAALSTGAFPDVLTTAPHWRTRIPAIDGLRACAVLAVMAFHFDFPLHGGFLGVDLFYANSGFVLARGLLDGARSSRSSVEVVARFVARRASRLLPAAAVAFGAIVVLNAVRGPSFGALPRTIAHALASLGGVGNWFVVVFPDRPGEVVRPLLHTWSLGVEEQAYAVLPLALLARRSSARASAFVVCGVGVVAALVFARMWSAPSVAFFSTPSRLAPVALGVGVAALLDGTRVASSRLTGWFGTALVLCVVPALLWFSWTDAWLYRGGFLVVGAVFAGLVGVAAVQKTGVLIWVLESQPVQFIGARSYSLYLVHFPCAYLFGSFGFGLRSVLRVAVSLVMAEALHRTVEYRFLRGDADPGTRWRFAPVAMAVFAVAGFTLAGTWR